MRAEPFVSYCWVDFLFIFLAIHQKKPAEAVPFPLSNGAVPFPLSLVHQTMPFIFPMSSNSKGPHKKKAATQPQCKSLQLISVFLTGFPY